MSRLLSQIWLSLALSLFATVTAAGDLFLNDAADASPPLPSVTETSSWCYDESCANCSCLYPYAADEHWSDNLNGFFGIDGAKQPQDFGVNANLGGRTHLNCGIPVVRDWGLGLQLGVGFNAHNNAVAVLQAVDGTKGRTQLFTTAGLFQRFDSGWSWALNYDYLSENYYSNFTLSQLRGRLGYAWTPCDEFGVWATIHTSQDTAVVAGQTVNLQAINMVNAYWSHQWALGTETMCWVGATNSHGREVLVFPDNSPTKCAPIFGTSLLVPLNDHWAIYGEANLIFPPNSGTVDAFLGFAYYPGGSVTRQRQLRFAPILPVANNTSFAIDLNR